MSTVTTNLSVLEYEKYAKHFVALVLNLKRGTINWNRRTSTGPLAYDTHIDGKMISVLEQNPDTNSKVARLARANPGKIFVIRVDEIDRLVGYVNLVDNTFNTFAGVYAGVGDDSDILERTPDLPEVRVLPAGNGPTAAARPITQQKPTTAAPKTPSMINGTEYRPEAPTDKATGYVPDFGDEATG